MDCLRPSEWSDVEYLASNLRTEDVDELLATGWQPIDSLAHGFNHSWPCYTVITPTGIPMGMTGIVACEHYDGFGRIWLLGTDDITNNPFYFLRRSQSVIERMWNETDFTALYNRVYIKQHIHINWLRWLGFKFINREGDFLTFIKLRGRSCVDPR